MIAQRRGQVIDKLYQFALYHGHEKGLSVWPVEVNRAFADTGMFGDIIDRDSAIAPALEELSSGIEDTLGAERPFIEFRRRIRDQSVYLVI